MVVAIEVPIPTISEIALAVFALVIALACAGVKFGGAGIFSVLPCF